jgi:hypothetical protein
LEQVKIAAIDKLDLDVGFAQASHARHSSESSPDDDNLRFRCNGHLNILTIKGTIELSITFIVWHT